MRIYIPPSALDCACVFIFQEGSVFAHVSRNLPSIVSVRRETGSGSALP